MFVALVAKVARVVDATVVMDHSFIIPGLDDMISRARDERERERLTA